MTISEALKKPLRPIVYKWRRFSICHKENAIAAKADNVNSTPALKRKALLLSHSLEREMSIPNEHRGAGFHRAKELVPIASALLASEDHDGPHFELSESVSVLACWYDWQKRLGFEVEGGFKEIKTLIQDYKNKYGLKLVKAGVTTLEKDSRAASFDEIKRFISSRRSVRQFSDCPVPLDVIRTAVELAQRAPSACNRQACRVYIPTGAAKAVVANSVRGKRGFENYIHQWAVITCDRALYLNNEAFQWYLDGGIFIYALLLAFHALGVECCIHQWLPMDAGDSVRETLEISEFEAICGVIGFGYPDKESRVLAAQRRQVDDVLILRGRNVE